MHFGQKKIMIEAIIASQIVTFFPFPSIHTDQEELDILSGK